MDKSHLKKKLIKVISPDILHKNTFKTFQTVKNNRDSIYKVLSDSYPLLPTVESHIHFSASNRALILSLHCHAIKK